MSNPTDLLSFNQGTEAIEEAAKTSGFKKDHYFGLDDGESAILRFITEAEKDEAIPGSGWVSVLQYGALPTKPKPDGYDGNWPKAMPVVARQDKAFAKLFEVGYFTHNWIHENLRDGKGQPYRPSPRTWALACLREEVRGDGTEATGGEAKKGKVVGYRDKTREVTIKKDDGTEETVQEKAIVIVNMGYKNFFALLIGFAQRYGTILDRDYFIKRKGADMNNTKYEIVPLDPTPNHDLRNPETMAKYDPPNLFEIILSRCSDEYIGRFWIPGWVDPNAKDKESSGGGSGGAPAEQQAKPDSEVVDEDKMAALKDRVMGYGQPEAPAAASDGDASPSSDGPEPVAAGSGPLNFD